MKRFLLLATVVTAAFSAAAAAVARADETPPQRSLVIKAGRLFDGTGDDYRHDVVIVIEGERIKAVGPAADVSIPDGAEALDLSDAFVLPGSDRLPHAPGRPGRSVRRNLQLQEHALSQRLCRRGERPQDARGRFHHRARRGLAAVPGRRPARRDRRGLPGRAARGGQRAGHLDDRRPRRPEPLRAAGPRQRRFPTSAISASPTAPTRCARSCVPRSSTAST